MLIKSILEIPFFAASNKLLQKFNYRMLLTISGVTYALRWLIVGFSDNLDVLLWSQILLSLAFSLKYFASVAYVDYITPVQYRASGQTLYWAVTLGVWEELQEIF